MKQDEVDFLRGAWNERPRSPRVFDLVYYAIRQWATRFNHR